MTCMKKHCYQTPLITVIEIYPEETIAQSPSTPKLDEVETDTGSTDDSGFTGGARSSGYRTSWPNR